MTDQTDWRAQGYALPPNEFSPEPEKPVPTGLQKLPRVWAYLTKDARPPEPTVDAFGNPITETVQAKAEPGKTQDGERSAFSGDWGDGDGPTSSRDAADFDPADVFSTMPPDLPITHGDRPIIENFARHMHGHSMTPTQVHEAIRWANGYQGDNLEKDFASHMEAHGLSRTQAQEANKWFTEYTSSEEALDDAAVADVDRAIGEIQALMGSPAYTKNKQMQADYLMLVGIRDGEGDE